ETAQRQYAAWMAAQPVAGVAVWAHTGRGPHLGPEQRRLVLDAWRAALPDRVLVAGARDIGMAIEARRGRADALLAFPERHDRVAQATFVEPMEGYIRRMLWAAAADGALPPDACDDPWGPPLPQAERLLVEQTVRDARAAGA